MPGPGGDVHALLVRPGGRRRPFATAFLVHGGPESADDDSYRARRAACVDAGYAVVHVNYRGSTGYGRAWRDALDRPARAHRARGRRRGLRRAGRRGHRRPAARVLIRRLVGRLPHAAGPGHAARALGASASPASRSRTTSPPTRTRWRPLQGLRPGAVRRLARGGARRLRATRSPITYVDAVARARAGRRRRERPALPDPADRQLPGAAGGAGQGRTRSTGSTPATARWSSRRPSARSRSRWTSPSGTCRRAAGSPRWGVTGRPAGGPAAGSSTSSASRTHV